MKNPESLHWGIKYQVLINNFHWVSKWDGDQQCSISNNWYIPRLSSKTNILLLCLVRYLSNVVCGNRYLPRGSKEYVLFIQLLGMYLLLCNHTTFGFCHDLQNSAKSFWENSIVSRWTNLKSSVSNQICAIVTFYLHNALQSNVAYTHDRWCSLWKTNKNIKLKK